MTIAKLRVQFAGPHVSFQDAGRFGQLRYGVPASGPMDRLSHKAAQIALEQPEGNTAIEISLGGLTLDCTQGAVSFAVTGGDFLVNLAAQNLDAWCVATLNAGERLTIRPGTFGSWAYLAFAGNPTVPNWLGHTATHALSGLGGGSLRTGQTFDIDDAAVLTDRNGPLPQPAKPKGDEIRVVMGPQDHQFQSTAIDALTNEPFKLTDKYDRMGVRLIGPNLPLRDALSIPSEPILRGSIQVSGDGIATVLLADHQTTGGYPKIATVISSDLDKFCQKRAGDKVMFKSVTPEAAIGAARETAKSNDAYLSALTTGGSSLSQRLLRENLISGIASATTTEP